MTDEHVPPDNHKSFLRLTSLRWSPLIGVALILLIAVGLNLAAFFARQQINDANRAVEAGVSEIVVSNDALEAAIAAQSAYRAYLLTGEQSFLDQYYMMVETYTQRWQGLIDRAPDSDLADNLRNLLNLLAVRRTNVIDPGIALRQQVDGGTASIDDVAAYLASEPGAGELERIRALVGELQAFEQAQMRQGNIDAERASASLQWLLIVIGIASLIAGLLLAAYIGRHITGPVAQIAGAARELAEGNLDRRTGVRQGNEIGQLAAAVDLMAERVQGLLQEKDGTLAAIQEHEAVLQAVIDSVAVGITMTDQSGRLILMNRTARQMIGVESENFTAYDPLEVWKMLAPYFADSGRQVDAVMDFEVFASDETVLTVIDQVLPELRQVELFSAPVHSAGGERLGRIFVQRDVTREREIDRMKTEFVSMVSHELRTPLTSIKGYVDLLREGEVGELTEGQRDFLEIVASSTDRLVALINDLLDISRIESGKIELKRDRLDLAASIRQVVGTFRPQIDAKHQRLTVELPPDPLPIIGDAGRITQILTNLLSNAHKYTPVGRDLTISAAIVDDMAEVHVTDTGIGLSTAEQAQLFTRFYRASNRTVQEAGGTGLGLAITRSLVELHGGTVSVRSSPGQGSTFSFTLPLVAKGGDGPAPAAEDGDQRRILVIEDEPDIAGLLRRFLERAGHGVSVAATAEDGLRLAKELRPDLITLDVHLPDVDGFTLLEWLRRDQGTRDIPVVMVTISPDEGQGQLLGAIDHLTKPVHEATLLERVHQILARDGRATILVAEDDGDTRRLIVALLRRAGHRTIEASDGAEAIAAAQRQAIQLDLALIDVRMPGTDGLATLRALRSDPRTRDLPILMMTASSGVESNRADIEALGATLLRKPLAASDLADAISGALERRDE